MKRKTIKITGVRWSLEELNRFIHDINHSTPEQQAEAMTRCTPEAEEWGRKFEDQAKSTGEDL